MTTNQEGRQAAVRALTGTARTYNEDWEALFDLESIASGAFDERLLLWINAQLSASYTSLPTAQSAYAASLGFVRWSDINTIGWSPISLFTPGTNGFWYDPSQASSVFSDLAGTIPASVSGPVGFISDLSGNGNNSVSPSNGQRTTLTSSASGNYLQFSNASNSGYNLGPVNLEYVAVAVANFANTSGLDTLMCITAGTDNNDIRCDNSPDTSWRIDGSSNSNSSDFGLGGNGWINGVSGFDAGSFSPHVMEVTAISLESLSNFGQAAFSGRGCSSGIAGLIGLNRVPSASEQAKIRTFLGKKIGLSL